MLHWAENLILVVLALWAFERLGPQLAALAGLDLGMQPSPTLELPTLDGRTFSLDAHRGQVVLVNFWATWCRPCGIEMPGFQKVYEEHRERGFTILGVATDVGGTESVADYVEARGVSYPIALATPEVRRRFGGVREIPTSFLIDRSGRIRHTVRGIWLGPALAVAVRRLLEEEVSPGSEDGADARSPRGL